MAVVVQTVIELSKKKFENSKQREREKNTILCIVGSRKNLNNYKAEKQATA